MPDTVRVAVIGCGAQGRNHLLAYRKDPAVEVVAVCDTDPARLREVATEFAVPHHYGDYRQLLDGASYDLVSICTMPVSHHEMVLAAFYAGANVLCEKPMAMNSDEATEMFGAAWQADRILTLGFNMRFMPNAQYLKRFVEGGGLGTPIYTHAWTFATDIPWWGKHYIKRISGGGVLASTAVHVLDLALWVGGNPRPVTASASMSRDFPRKRGESAPSREAAASFDVEDTFSGHIRFEDGSWMTLEGGWSWDRTDYSYSFEMAGDAAAVQFAPLRVVAERDGNPVDATPDRADNANGLDGWQQSVEAEIADVVAAVREGRQPLVRAEEALIVQAFVDALYRSAELRQEVPVVLPPVVGKP
jgi:predicted dehydrogenase